ncbi:MAG: AAA family ATPase [bacterium]|nr:AAA family ATPase [bacterium]
MAKANRFHKISDPKDVKYAEALDPLQADDPRYVPLAEVRQDNVPMDIYKRLKSAVEHPKRKAAHICYAGHRGCGKTTELFMVMKKLKQEAPFHFVYKAADADLAAADLDYPDIMLYLAKTAMEGMPDDVKIDEKLLESIEKWFAERVVTDQNYRDMNIKVEGKMEAGFSIPGLFKLLAGLTSSFKGGHKSAVETRLELRRQPQDLIDKINELFSILRDALENAGKPHELVLVLDNLDRLPPEIMEYAFSKWANLFGQLQVHLLVTVPLPLIYYPTRTKLSDMGFRQVVLSMPKIRSRRQEREKFLPEAVDKLMDVIKARVEIEKVFAGSEVERLNSIRRIVLVSGGSLRDMMHIFMYAGEEAWDVPITAQYVETAIHKVRSELMSNLSSDDIRILLKLHKEKRADRTTEVGRQLHYRWALEYNGEKWADVHPLVYESSLYREAAALDGNNEK